MGVFCSVGLKVMTRRGNTGASDMQRANAVCCSRGVLFKMYGTTAYQTLATMIHWVWALKHVNNCNLQKWFFYYGYLMIPDRIVKHNTWILVSSGNVGGVQTSLHFQRIGSPLQNKKLNAHLLQIKKKKFIYYFFLQEPVKHCTHNHRLWGAISGSWRLSFSNCLLVSEGRADSYTDRKHPWTTWSTHQCSGSSPRTTSCQPQKPTIVVVHGFSGICEWMMWWCG